MSHQKEYQGKANGQTGCTYSRLKDVAVPFHAPSAVVGTQSSLYQVPQFCPTGAAPNYPPQPNTLFHGQPYLCGGYFNMKAAYPSATCTECKAHYVKRPCMGSISCNSSAPAKTTEPYCKILQEGYCGSCGVEGYRPFNM